MENKRDHRVDEERSAKGPHGRFLELCAILTSGDLTEEEQKDLQAHLAECPDCRQALKEFEAVADIGVPLLHSELSGSDSLELDSLRSETVKAPPDPAMEHEEMARGQREPADESSGLGFSHRNGYRPLEVNWNYVWMPFAAAILLTAALGIYSFQVGKQKGQQNVLVQLSAQDRKYDKKYDTKVDALEQKISDAGRDREVLKAQLADRDRMIADLQRQVADRSAALNEMKSAQIELQHSLQSETAAKQQIAQGQNNLSERLDAALSTLQKAQAELDSVREQRALEQTRADGLSAQIRELHGQLRDQQEELGKEQELLAHDRDIRELMGARDLYIAEVYDVARDGQTQKPYGRVFYTKGKSLVFYAYDLDQQDGYKTASTFQAWGSRGLDKQQATSLGIFYKDSAAKKRWVVKFDDPKKLEQINAVFVTVEPNGGSHRPSGKPLLFAYLKVDPNHP
jgi:Putative zinc-finger